MFTVGSTQPPTRDENQNHGTPMLAIDVAPIGTDFRLAVLRPLSVTIGPRSCSAPNCNR